MTGPYAESVLRQLMDAGRRQHRTRRRRIGSAIAAAVAAVTGSLVLLLPNPAAADVRITIDGGVVEVHLTDRDTTVEEIVDAFADKGLTTVSAVEGPTGPSAIGRFILVETVGGDPQQVEADSVDGSFTTFRVREGWSGQLRVTLGRQARPGESYLQPTDAFLPGEALHCAGVHGQRLRLAADRLVGFDVRVNFGTLGSLGGQEDLPAAVAEHGDWVVTDAQSVSPSDLVLTVEPLEPWVEDRC